MSEQVLRAQCRRIRALCWTDHLLALLQVLLLYSVAGPWSEGQHLVALPVLLVQVQVQAAAAA